MRERGSEHDLGALRLLDEVCGGNHGEHAGVEVRLLELHHVDAQLARPELRAHRHDVVDHLRDARDVHAGHHLLHHRGRRRRHAGQCSEALRDGHRAQAALQPLQLWHVHQINKLSLIKQTVVSKSWIM